MQSKTLTKLIGFLAFVALVAGATVAAWDYEPDSSSRRGGSAERIWHGLLALVGQEENATGGMIWLGRGLALLAVALFVLFVVRRLRAGRPTAEQQYALQQPYAPAQYEQGQYEQGQYEPQQYQQPRYEPQYEQPQPTPPPVPAPSWGAVTSGPTPLPVVPPPAEREPDPSATRQVIIPPLPPNWGRN